MGGYLYRDSEISGRQLEESTFAGDITITGLEYKGSPHLYRDLQGMDGEHTRHVQTRLVDLAAENGTPDTHGIGPEEAVIRIEEGRAGRSHHVRRYPVGVDQ